MANRATALLVQAVRLANADTGQSDSDLLTRYAEHGDQSAFAAVMHRHLAMVLGVCWRVLRSQADAEDACQAVFLILAKKVNSTCWRTSVANWLYATARNVALNARLASTRRTKREGAAAAPESVWPIDALTAREMAIAVDEELDKLPQRYREPLVLCYLEGLTRDEVAARLSVSTVTLKKQLERARKMLADSLAARGHAQGIALLATAATASAVASTPRLLDAIMSAVGGSPSATSAALAKEVAMTGLLAKIKLAALATVGVAAIGLGFASVPNTTEPSKPATAKNDTPTADATPPKPTKLLPETITIRVRDPDGKPVAGATIYRRGRSLLKTSPTENDLDGAVSVVMGKTDVSGTFETDCVPSVIFYATAEGFCVASSGSVIQGDTLELRLARPLPIKGRLVDLQGKPISNAKVSVLFVSAADKDDLTAAYNAYRANPEWTWPALPMHLDGQATGAPKGAVTNADGRFDLTGVGLNRVVDLQFEAAGIESARVSVFADPEFAKRMKLPTEAEKKMSSMSGDYRAAVYGPEFTHAARPEHVITGTVTDAVTAKPIAGVKVAGTTSDLSRLFVGNPWHDRVETVTDANGRFKLGGLVKAKKRFIQVMGTDVAPYLDQLCEVNDTEAYAPAVVAVKLQPAVLVEGQLLNKSTGKPVIGEAYWMALNGNPLERSSPDGDLYFGHTSARTSGTQAHSGADGRFQLRIPGWPGVVLARVEQQDSTAVFTPLRVQDEDKKYLRKKTKDPNVIETGPRDREDEEYFDTDLLIPLRWENGYSVIKPGMKSKSIEVKIAFDPGKSVTLNATDPDGKPLDGVTLVGPGPYGLRPPTFANSEITVGGIDPKGKPVQLYLLHKKRKLCAELKVKGDETGSIAVRMKPCGEVTGRVVDHTGKPMTGARVMFQMTDHVADDLLRQKMFRGATETATDADGKFSFTHMFPDVEFDLFVSLPGFRNGASGSKQANLKPGETKDVGEFKLIDPKKIPDE
jgi:RNA polymerase sigma factor (sigma-70 family)